jgi:hypothetical protein
LRKETIPLSHWKIGVDGDETRNEVVFERANGTFSGVDAVFMRWYTLEGYAIGKKSIFEVLCAFIVEDVEFRGVALVHKEFVCSFPGVSNAGAFAVGNADGVNGIGVLVVEDENIMVASAGGDGEQSCLVGIGFQDGVLVQDGGTKVMRALGQGR